MRARGEIGLMKLPTITKGRHHPYIKWPAPVGIRPRSAMPWRVLDLCKAYNFPTAAPGGGVIGIVELAGGWTQADLDLFSQLNGLPSITAEDVSADGTNNNSNPDPNADGEVALDIQVAAAAYFAATGTMPQIQVIWAGDIAPAVQMAAQSGCDVCSISWGADEKAWTQNPGSAQQMEATATQATQQGCIVFAAAGDNSSGDGDPAQRGFTLRLPTRGRMRRHHEDPVFRGRLGQRPARRRGDWRRLLQCLPTAELANRRSLWSRTHGAGCRRQRRSQHRLPDRRAWPGSTGWRDDAVAPFYAGLFAAFGKRLGFVTPMLYQHPQAFVDITQGSNGSYSAAIGPDPCTGLGVPTARRCALLAPVGTAARQGHLSQLCQCGERRAGIRAIRCCGNFHGCRRPTPQALTSLARGVGGDGCHQCDIRLDHPASLKERSAPSFTTSI